MTHREEKQKFLVGAVSVELLPEESDSGVVEVVVGGDAAERERLECPIVFLDRDAVGRLEGRERAGDYAGEEGVNGGRVRLLQLVVAVSDSTKIPVTHSE